MNAQESWDHEDMALKAGRKYARSLFEHAHAVLCLKLSEEDLAKAFAQVIRVTTVATLEASDA